MYICQSCKGTFAEPRTFEEDHGLLDGGLPEYLGCCPYCGGDFEPAEMCENCSKVYPISERYHTDVCSEACWNAMSDRAALNDYGLPQTKTIKLSDAMKPVNMIELAAAACGIKVKK